jgi:hypothetical protein
MKPPIRVDGADPSYLNPPQRTQGLYDTAIFFLELKRILSLPIGDEKKEWILSKNPKSLIGLK